MEIMYQSTRRSGTKVTASQAILKGLADDGGLFVPERFPKFEVPLGKLGEMSYQETAYEVMRLFFTDFTEEELRACINGAYDKKFDTPVIAPLVRADEAGACAPSRTGSSVSAGMDSASVNGGAGENAWYLELFHGKTIAFKDMALSILPYLMTTAAKKNGVKNEIVILTATSGDTGKAALAGFADVPGTSIIVFYPKDGVSPIQKKQMVTEPGKNTMVVGVDGNFDDCQTGVKNIFNNKELAERMDTAGYQFSSANSINIGRLVPQIVYYVYSYGQLLKNGAITAGEQMDVVVPTGNFGNILAAYYAKQIGLPVGTLYCASNENKVLFDFFGSGTYDRKREFILTSSPSMDILISSNLERLIYKIAENDPDRTAAFMKQLTGEGEYTITDEMRRELAGFVGGFATEVETAREIAEVYERTGYVLDPHTAVASFVCRNKANAAEIPTVVASTASPYKFTRSVMKAIDEGKYSDMEDFALVDELHRISGVEIPEAIETIRTAAVVHDTVCGTGEMQQVVEAKLGIS
ncbi:MAG: threonine synthase [Eubacterium sp.]|nr:threonine synthase [Eubacterium sp.]